MQKFLTVKEEQESTLIINYSKFICSVKYVEREDDAREYISLVKKRHVLASSFAYAYISDLYGNNIKFNDGGEPQGTAGMPILNVLKNK
ncbi:MAG: YigZ family protein, partial [Clostridia bacterium]|nr:YigZ family protein [Clostridia bacterium]